MDPQEFSTLRHRLGKTQKQMAQLLGTSLKAVQSFEQGWRKIPVHIERQALFLVSSQKGLARKSRPCWVIRGCSSENRESCPAWEFNLGYLCWFVNGTICHGKTQGSWSQKMKVCRSCEVFSQTMTTANGEKEGHAGVKRRPKGEKRKNA